MNQQTKTREIMQQQTKAEKISKPQFKTGPIMAALLVAGFVGLFSETALNIALGDLSQIFNVNATTIQWLATGYFLTLGILVPVTGILMQKFTTRQMFLTSISLTLIGTILAAVAPVFSILLMGRIIQAAGLAINLPLTQNVIFTIFPPNKRGGAMGIMGLVMLAGPALGPTLAGLILDTLSWHWIFWVTTPFLLFSLIFGLKYLPNVNEIRKVSIDVLSVILSTIGFWGIVYGVSVGGEHGWTNTTVIASIIIGFVALIIFAIRQKKMETPMLNLKAFHYPLFVLGVIMSFITFFNMLSNLRLTIVNVINTRSFEAYDRSVVERAQQIAEQILNGYKSLAEAEGIKNVKVVMEYGSPKTIITGEIADLTRADLIMCGATGLNAVERFLTGSVSEAIVRSAKCDVLVIRRPVLHAVKL